MKRTGLNFGGNKTVHKCLSFVTVFAFVLFFSSEKTQAQVSGIVFKDYNSDGQISTSAPKEAGIANITVRAFVGNGATSFQTTTNSLGAYSFSASDIPAGSKVRLEFSNFGASSHVGIVGAQSTSSVQFVTAPTTDAHLGILRSDDYCQPEPRFAIPCYVNGDPNSSTGDPDKDAANADVLVTFDYKAVGQMSNTGFMAEHLAYGRDMGAVWGTAYHARTKHLINSAVIRRHSGLGQLGTGGLYKTNIETAQVSPYFNLSSLGINTGADPHSTLSPNKTVATADPGAYAAAGKVGIGGMDITVDGKKLFISNLFDKTLYSVEVGKNLRVPTAADVKRYPIPNGDCPNGDYVAWAVMCEDRDVYVGVNCTGQTTNQRSELKATIYKIDTSGVGGFKKIIQFPIDFLRGAADRTGNCIQNNHWDPWSDTFPTPCAANFVMRPQPILSDLALDDDGYLNIGFIDRFGLQSGSAHPDLNGNGSYMAFTGGDLMLAAPLADGTFQIENNGRVGTKTGSGAGNSQGNGGGEFYAEEDWKFYGNIAHDEVLQGSLMKIPGYNEILSTSFDPIDEIYMSQGWQIYSSVDGKIVREFAIWGESDKNKPYVFDGTFGKSTSLGRGMATCDPDPLEIGNRLWNDTDRDGIQDPNEVGIDDIEVLLCDAATNLVVGRTRTRNGGQYYFNSGNVSVIPTNLGLEYDKNYVIKVPKNQSFLGTFTGISPVNAGTNDELDSDASAVADAYQIAFRTGDIGSVNHSYDFGFVTCTINAGTDISLSCSNGFSPTRVSLAAQPSVGAVWTQHPSNPTGAVISSPSSATSEVTGLQGDKTYLFIYGSLNCTDTVRVTTPFCVPPPASMGNYAWYDLNRNGIQDLRIDPFGTVLGPELPVKGAIFELYNTTGTLINKDTTDANGIYGIGNLSAGSYYVKFNPVSYPSPKFVATDPSKGTNRGLDSDFPRGTYTSNTFNLVAGQNDPNWDMGFFIPPGDGPSISDPCSCDTTILYTVNSEFSKYVYREVVTVRATPGGRWFVIAKDNKRNVSTRGVFVSNAEGFVVPMDLGQNRYQLTEDSVGVYNFVFAHKSNDGYALAVTDGVDTLSITAVCNEIKEQYDARLENTCGVYDRFNLQRNFANGIATYYLLDTKRFEFRDGFDEFELIKAAVARGPITEFNPALYQGLTDIALYVKWVPTIAVKGACQKTVIINVVVSPPATCVGSIGDYVWKDTNENGQQDAGEQPVVGMKVILWSANSAGSPVAKLDSVNTNNLGKYLFSNRIGGNYIVQFVASTAPADCNGFTTPNSGNDASDSDVSTAGLSPMIVLNPALGGINKDNLTIDAGLRPLKGSIGDYVWKDSNENGQQDTGEQPVAGMKVILWSANSAGNPVAKLDSVNTNSLGRYLFSNLLKADYIVQFVASTAPVGCDGFTSANIGNDASDSDVGNNGLSPVVRLDPGRGGINKDNLTIDAGLKPIAKASMGNYAWYDLNRNGIQDLRRDPFGTVLGPELPAQGIVFELFDNNNILKGKDTTDVNGIYGIGNLLPGQYCVKFNPASYPNSAFVTTDNDKGTNDALDSDIPRGTYKSASFFLAAGQNDPNWDMGFYRPASPSIADPCKCDTLFQYYVSDTPEFLNNIYTERVTVRATPGGQWFVIPRNNKTGTTTYGIQVYDNTTKYLKAITPSTQRYQFYEDSTGRYEFDFYHRSSVGYAIVVTDGVDTLEIGYTCFEVKEKYDTRLEGFCGRENRFRLQTDFATGTSKYYFLRNRAFETNNYTDETGEIKRAIARGEITELNPSDYTPNSTISLVMIWTPNVQGKGACPKPIIFNVPVFGTELCTGSIGDYVWKDTNENGQQDAGEQPVVGMKVILWSANSAGNPVAKLDSVNTTLAGKYLFSGLLKGDYLVQFVASTAPTDCDGFTTPNVGTNPANNSDANPTTGISGVIKLDPANTGTSKDNLTIDAGLKPKPVECIPVCVPASTQRLK